MISQSGVDEQEPYPANQVILVFHTAVFPGNVAVALETAYGADTRSARVLLLSIARRVKRPAL